VRAKKMGYFFWSADKRQAVQARLDGFSFSRLRPYESWNALHAEAQRLWELYVQVAQPLSVERVALRYINRIELPTPLDLEEYLATYPELGDGCPQTLSDLYMRLVAQQGAATVVITEAIDDSSVKPGSAAFILDIDVFQRVRFPPSDSSQLWSILAEIRKLKNDVFFNSITSKTAALFE
jgi:uncharacterized protein (TIGR04255 family)